MCPKPASVAWLFRAHGEQEGRFFHRYYDHYCFLPLYVFCGDRPLASYLRPSRIDAAVVRPPRCGLRHRRGQERALLAISSPLRALAKRRNRATGEKQRLFGEVRYGARSWNAARRVIVKAEHGPRGGNPRFVVTSLAGDARRIYERVYCARGDMENRLSSTSLRPETNLIRSLIDANRGRIVSLMQYPG